MADSISQPRRASGETVNTNYLVRITSNKGAKIIAHLPEELVFSIQSNWEPLIGNAIDSIMDRSTLASALFKGGKALGLVSGQVHVAQTVQAWAGTEPIQITLALLFDAVEDAYKDVHLPVVQLMRLAAPSQNNAGVLSAPGPTGLQNAASSAGLTLTDGESIEIQIGKHIRFSGVVIKSVDPTWSTKKTEEGYSISADVNVVIETPFVPTKQFIDEVFSINAEDRIPLN